MSSLQLYYRNDKPFIYGHNIYYVPLYFTSTDFSRVQRKNGGYKGFESCLGQKRKEKSSTKGPTMCVLFNQNKEYNNILYILER